MRVRVPEDRSKTEERGVLPAEVAARNGHMTVARVLSEATLAAAGPSLRLFTPQLSLNSSISSFITNEKHVFYLS